RNTDVKVNTEDVANASVETNAASVKVNRKRKVNFVAGVGGTKVNNDVTADVDIVDARVDKENQKVDINAKPNLKNVKVGADNKVEKGTNNKRQVAQ
ncbi:15299_t:CDS:1, partial [Funneliformis mosseae]